MRCACRHLVQVYKQGLKRRRFTLHTQELQQQPPAMDADHASCSRLPVPNSALRLQGKSLVRIPLPSPVPGMKQAASLRFGLPYIADPAALSLGASANILRRV